MAIRNLLVSALALCLVLVGRSVTAAAAPAPKKQPDHTSKVPKYTFADTLDEQLAQLRSNPLLARFAESRATNLEDPHHPIYHYVAPENRMNDPNGLCFWQGRWHLFYQGYPPEDPRQHWGHAVSNDLIHWRDLPYAIYPQPEQKCFSGSALVEDNLVIAIYHGIRAGTMVAVSSDPLLLNWKKVTGQAIIPIPKPDEPKVPYNIFDPCIWKHGAYYYALTAGTLPDGPGGQRVRAEFLHRSKDLAHWEYLHPFLENDAYGLVGDDGACPYFWPIGDKHILLHFSHMSGGKYLLGDYDTERQKFVVTGGGDFNHGSVKPAGTHAPSACPDGKGGIIAIFNMNPGKPTRGWNQIMTLPRRLTLRGKDHLNIEPAGDIESLRHGHKHVGPMTLPANEEVVLEGVAGSAMELAAEIDTRGAPMVELNVLRSPQAEEVTRIRFYHGRGYRGASVLSIDSSRSSTLPDAQSRPPENAQVHLGGKEPLRLRVFIDRSVVEVFANGKQCAAIRVYPGRDDSIGVSLRAQGREATLTSLDAWQMTSIYKPIGVTPKAAASPPDDDPDAALIADFEGTTYSKGWKAEGKAFGAGPARGSIGGQRKVTGFKGKGLVNSFLGGDKATGTLTSPPFEIKRDHINFLIGGGGYQDETCMHLLVGDEVVRRATGPNTRPGGSERLEWRTWDVRNLTGKKAVIRIIDNRTAGWGHVNVDHIVQSETPRETGPAKRTLTVEKRYLHLPVANGAREVRMTVTAGETVVDAFDIELAEGEPDFYAFLDMREHQGKKATIAVDLLGPDAKALERIRQSDKVPGADAMYTEALRPQFHFSPRRGWTNDPNGLVYYDGEYHLFFQHNPYGWKWGNMHWGHAVSPDLVHWTELPDAIYPDQRGTIFSGSAVADLRNTSGLQGGGPHPPLVCVFTYAGRFADPPCPYTQGIAWSVDRGRTFTKHPQPVLGNHGPRNRDPKVIWHEPTKRWVMLLYLGDREKFAFFGSKDLKQWKKLSDLTLPGGHECPEIFELPVDRDAKKTRWVVYAGSAQYTLGDFDGTTFTPGGEGQHRVHWGSFYASQTYNNTPDGRRIQVGWGRIAIKGMPFNQMMTFPCRLTLRSTPDGIRVFAEPVKEIEKLRKRKRSLGRTRLKAGAEASVGTSGRLFDIRAAFTPGSAKVLGLQIGDTKVAYNTSKHTLMGMPLKPVDGKVHVRVLVDRPSMEVFGNRGRVVHTKAFYPEGEIEAVRVFAEGGSATLESLEVFELESAWQ